MAGIWEEWKNLDGSRIQSFSIITTEANNLMKPLHDRMPVILSQSNENLWLSDLDTGELSKLLMPYP